MPLAAGPIRGRLEIEADAQHGSVQRLLDGECAIELFVGALEVQEVVAGRDTEVVYRLQVKPHAAGPLDVRADAEAAAFKRGMHVEKRSPAVVANAQQRIPDARLALEVRLVQELHVVLEGETADPSGRI